jgi:hypothetical protein
MVRFPTLVLGATLGLAALGLSATASAGVRVGVDVGLPVVAPGALVEPGLAYVGYRPAPYYHGPRFYGGAPYYGRYYGAAHGYGYRGPVGPHGGYGGSRDGHGWHR